MATITECDRCGERIPNPFGTSVLGLKLYASIGETFDLCPECAEVFRAFMKNDSVSSTTRVIRAEAKK